MCSNLFSSCFQQQLLKNYFTFHYQHRKLFSYKRKKKQLPSFHQKKKIVRFRFFFIPLQIFAGEVYYAMYCMLWVYGHYNCFNSFSAGTVFRRQILTSNDGLHA